MKVLQDPSEVPPKGYKPVERRPSEEEEVLTIIDTDQIWYRIGQFGNFQWVFFFIISLQSISFATHNLASVYLAADQDHHCIYPFDGRNLTAADQCSIVDDVTGVKEKCVRWEFDTSFRESSITSEWSIVCDQKWLRAVIQAVYMGGLVTGSFFMGDLSDRYGRVPILFASSILLFVTSIATSFCPEFVSFCFTRFMNGISVAGVHNIAYVWLLEIVGTDYRAMAAVASELFWSCGFLLLAFTGYLIRDWVRLQLAIGVPTILFMLYKWVLPESPRWLLAQQRYDEAEGVFKLAAKMNHKRLPKLRFKDLAFQEKTTYTFIDILRTPNLRKRTFVLWYCWFVVCLVFYGLSLNASNLAGNPYLTFAAMGVVELPAFIFCIVTFWKIGRRTTLIASFSITGVVLLARLLIPFFPIEVEVQTTLDTACAMIGKMAATAAFCTMYVYTTEVYPTVIRSLGLGATSMMARMGGVLSPFMAGMMATNPTIPQTVFGLSCALSALLLLLLPETAGRPLPETLEDGENFGVEQDDKCEEKKRIEEYL
jgi:OCT family organic cation transporter-like MFS transporter 4/5